MITKNINNINQRISLNNNAGLQGRSLSGNQNVFMNGFHLNFPKRSIPFFGAILFMLIRAETDIDIATTNVWQAVLLSAASQGDLIAFSF